LVSAEEDILTVKSSITQTASKQKLQIPAVPSMKLDLEKMEGQGAGESKVDLSKIVPEGSANLHSEISASMKAGDKPQSLIIKTDVKVTIQAK
jgi:hypothetical protein